MSANTVSAVGSAWVSNVQVMDIGMLPGVISIVMRASPLLIVPARLLPVTVRSPAVASKLSLERV